MHIKMIRFSTYEDIPQLRLLWKEVFGDSDAFLDLYFKQMFVPEQCVLSVEGVQLVAAMQLLPYNARIKGKIYHGRYIFAVMTSPTHRKQGHMQAMFDFVFENINRELISFLFLIPQENYLFDVYAKFGFEASFKQTIFCPTELLLSENIFTPSAFQAYSYYFQYFSKQDGVLLNEAQFEFVCDSLSLEGGELFAISSHSELTGLVIVLPKDKELVILACWAESSVLQSQLYSFVKSRYPNLPVRFSAKEDFMGMVKVLDNSISYADFANLPLALMLNE